MAKRVRIKDIAEHLGLSPSTVSRALNPETRSMISTEVVEQVQQQKYGEPHASGHQSLCPQRHPDVVDVEDEAGLPPHHCC